MSIYLAYVLHNDDDEHHHHNNDLNGRWVSFNMVDYYKDRDVSCQYMYNI